MLTKTSWKKRYLFGEKVRDNGPKECRSFGILYIYKMGAKTSYYIIRKGEVTPLIGVK